MCLPSREGMLHPPHLPALPCQLVCLDLISSILRPGCLHACLALPHCLLPFPCLPALLSLYSFPPTHASYTCMPSLLPYPATFPLLVYYVCHALVASKHVFFCLSGCPNTVPCLPAFLPYPPTLLFLPCPDHLNLRANWDSFCRLPMLTWLPASPSASLSLNASVLPFFSCLPTALALHVCIRLGFPVWLDQPALFSDTETCTIKCQVIIFSLPCL